MTTKYLKYLSAKDWAKASVPLVFLGIVLFLSGTISETFGSLISDRMINIKGIHRVNLDKESQDFALALAGKKKIEPLTNKDYSNYINREFINKQNNDITITKVGESGNKRADAGDELPPAPQYIVSSIFEGKTKKYAVIDSKVVRIGETLQTGETVAAIEDGKVLLKGRWGTRWISVKY